MRYLPIDQRPERSSLLPLRKHFNLFANLRPCKIYKNLTHASPLKDEIIQKGMDIYVLDSLQVGFIWQVRFR